MPPVFALPCPAVCCPAAAAGVVGVEADKRASVVQAELRSLINGLKTEGDKLVILEQIGRGGFGARGWPGLAWGGSLLLPSCCCHLLLPATACYCLPAPVWGCTSK